LTLLSVPVHFPLHVDACALLVDEALASAKMHDERVFLRLRL
jgi:hypothetical protein